MANTMMYLPDTLEEFMERYKVVDTEQIYTNGTELVPIFRIKQWFISHPCEPPRWIPVTERTPEEQGTYLVTVNDGGIGVAIAQWWYNYLDHAEGYFVCDDCYAEDIVAWMPLPTPYKGGEEDE